MRPVGAVVFGALAERFGRRPALMLNVVSYSVFVMASAFAPTFGWFLAMRGLFGIAMGGEWGVGAALALESLPAEGRGFFSGLLQEGYVVGSMLAALLYLVFPHLHGVGLFTAWRMLFVMGAVPSLLLLLVLRGVDESPAWLARRRAAAAGIVRAAVDGGGCGEVSAELAGADGVDDGVHVVQSWDAGFVSYVSEA